MKAILAVVLCLSSLLAVAGDYSDGEESYNSLPQEHQDHVRGTARAIRQEIEDGGMPRLALRTDQALDQLVARGVSELRDKGDDIYATRTEWDWKQNYQGYLTRGLMLRGGRDIGDHAPLIKWLASFYDHLESVLGVDACRALHLSDIKTFNFCIPVVFHPCTFPMDSVQGAREDEYRRHFAKGAVYYGLMPVILYWTADIACLAGTYGTGIGWLCGPISSAAEFITGKWIAPKVSDFVFERADCPKEEF